MRSLSKLVTPLPGHSLLRHVWPLIRFLNFGLMERIRFFAFRLWLSSDLILSFGLPNFKSNSNFSHPLSVAGDSPAAINSPQKKKRLNYAFQRPQDLTRALRFCLPIAEARCFLAASNPTTGPGRILGCTFHIGFSLVHRCELFLSTRDSKEETLSGPNRT